MEDLFVYTWGLHGTKTMSRTITVTTVAENIEVARKQALEAILKEYARYQDSGGCGLEEVIKSEKPWIEEPADGFSAANTWW